jgi:ankyrin repeat protein
MRLRRTATLALLLAFLQTLAWAQDPKQALNDQLWEAARTGDAAQVKALLDRGADVNAKFRYGTTALFKAAERGHAEVVRVLLERGADVSVRDTFYGATAMSWAMDKGHTEVVRAILAKSAGEAGDVLLSGARNGNADMVRIALEQGGIPAATLTAALASASADEKKAAIAEMLRKAGAVPPPEVAAETLASYAGKYQAETGREITIALKDGRLSAAAAGQGTFGLMAVDNTTFRPTDFDGITITFNVEGGKVTGFAFKQGQNTTVYRRVEEVKKQ